MAFLKRLIVWTLLAVPLGIAIGALVSLTWGPDSDIDRATAGFNGAVAGFWLGLIGAFVAAATTRIAREPLRRRRRLRVPSPAGSSCSGCSRSGWDC